MRVCVIALFLLVATLANVNHVESANILVVAFFSSKSHKLTYLPLIEELGKRGHNITIVSPVKPMKEMKNVKEIFTFDLEVQFQQKDFNPFAMKEAGTTINPSTMISLILDTCDVSLDLPHVKALVDEKFDLVFVQPLFNDCVFPLVYRIQAPFVLFTPTGVPSFIINKVGGHFPSSFTPNFMMGYPSEMNFYQRFMNLGVDLMVSAYMDYYYEPRVEKIYREKWGQDIPSISEIYLNASLVLSNGHFSLIGPMPLSSDVIEVGGIHSKPAKPIPKDLEDFIQKGKDGFILFSMGSAIKGDMMPEKKRKMILNVFSKLKQQVLWKWESETMPDLPKNVKLSKWLPQQDLLGHKNIKMFITHCGGGSTEESIYHGVPLVGIPMLGDQPKNAKTAKEHGFLVELSWNELNEVEFLAAIQEILNNPVYTDNVKRLSTLFKDRPMNPLDLGAYWVEYVLRHKGAPHLRSASRKLGTISYHSIDVLAAYIAITALVLYIVFAIVKLIAKKTCFRSKTQPKVSLLTSKLKKRN